MRSLFEIVEAAKGGVTPTHEECYFALLALDALWGMDRRDLRGLALGAARQDAASLAEASFARGKRALAADPRAWLGDDVPGNPAYDARRRAALDLLDRLAGGTDPR